MVQVRGLESLGLSPLGCVSLSRCPWAQEVGPGCCGWVSTGQPCGGEPWRVTLCRWSDVPSAISQQGSLVLAAAASQSSPVSPQFMGHIPWPQALGFGAHGRKPVTHRAPNALLVPISYPLHIPFPVRFPEGLGKLCFSWYLWG